jgi:hypothetical protein
VSCELISLYIFAQPSLLLSEGSINCDDRDCIMTGIDGRIEKCMYNSVGRCCVAALPHRWGHCQSESAQCSVPASRPLALTETCPSLGCRSHLTIVAHTTLARARFAACRPVHFVRLQVASTTTSSTKCWLSNSLSVCRLLALTVRVTSTCIDGIMSIRLSAAQSVATF